MVAQALELSRKPHVVIATPGRLADHLRSSNTFSLKKIKFLVRRWFSSFPACKNFSRLTCCAWARYPRSELAVLAPRPVLSSDPPAPQCCSSQLGLTLVCLG